MDADVHTFKDKQMKFLHDTHTHTHKQRGKSESNGAFTSRWSRLDVNAPLRNEIVNYDRKEVGDRRKGRGSPLGRTGLETHSAGSLRQHKDGGGLGGQAPTLSLATEESRGEGRRGRKREIRGRGELKLWESVTWYKVQGDQLPGLRREECYGRKTEGSVGFKVKPHSTQTLNKHT